MRQRFDFHGTILISTCFITRLTFSRCSKSAIVVATATYIIECIFTFCVHETKLDTSLILYGVQLATG